MLMLEMAVGADDFMIQEEAAVEAQEVIGTKVEDSVMEEEAKVEDLVVDILIGTIIMDEDTDGSRKLEMIAKLQY